MNERPNGRTGLQQAQKSKAVQSGFALHQNEEFTYLSAKYKSLIGK